MDMAVASITTSNSNPTMTEATSCSAISSEDLPNNDSSLSSSLAFKTNEYGQSLHRLRVLLIRHGESQNNILYAKSQALYRAKRLADPDLTRRGKKQALACAKYLSRAQKQQQQQQQDEQQQTNVNDHILGNIDAIYTSPMLRTLRTTQPIAKALGLNPTIWTDSYEVAGLHLRNTTSSHDTKDDKTTTYIPTFVGVPGLTRSAMSQLFPNYILPDDDDNITDDDHDDDHGWYDVSLGKESRVLAIRRIQSVANKLYRMAKQCEEDRNGGKNIILVCHGDFIDILLQELLGLDVPTSKFKKFLSYNTGISVIDVTADPRGYSTLLVQNFVDHLMQQNQDNDSDDDHDEYINGNDDDDNNGSDEEEEGKGLISFEELGKT